MEINHRSDVVKLTFRALALSSEQRRLWKIIKTVICGWIIFILSPTIVAWTVHKKRFEETSLRNSFFHPFSCLCLPFVNVFLLNISSHSKVCHFTLFSLADQHISSCQVSVNNLKRKVTGDISIRRRQNKKIKCRESRAFKHFDVNLKPGMSLFNLYPNIIWC